MTINEYQKEALRTAAGMNHSNNDEGTESWVCVVSPANVWT